MARKVITTLVIFVVVSTFSGWTNQAAAQNSAEISPAPLAEQAPVEREKQEKKSIFGKKPKKQQEGWAARELKKDGYDPKTMTGKDIRKMMGVE